MPAQGSGGVCRDSAVAWVLSLCPKGLGFFEGQGSGFSR